MMNFQGYLKNKLSQLDSQALNSLRLVIILSLALVFGVVLYRQTFNAPLLAKQSVASANPQAVSRVGAGFTAIKDELVVAQGDAEELAVNENIQEGDIGQENEQINTVVVLPSAGQDADNIKNLSAKAAIVVDGDTGEVIFQKNADEKLPMASLTKLMTAVIISENFDLEEKIKISKDAVAQDSVAGGLEKDEEFTAEDLMKVMLIVSSNDAAMAFQEYFAGKNLDLIALMNRKAEELGMRDTRFANVAGLDDDGHYSTARDLVKLASYVLKTDGTILGIISQKQSTVRSLNKNIPHYLLSTNQLLQKNNQEILGGKTGFTKNAQGCMISVLKSGKVIVVLGSQDRFGETERLIQSLMSKL